MFEFILEFSSIIYFLIALSVLIIIFGQAFLGRWLANEKCRDQVTWFWLCLFLGIPALITLGFSQTIDIRKIAQKIDHGYNSEILETWKCPKCSMDNPNNSHECKGCGYKLT